MRKVMSMTAAVLAIAAMPAVAQSLSGTSKDNGGGGGADQSKSRQPVTGMRKNSGTAATIDTPPVSGNSSSRENTQSNIESNMHRDGNGRADSSAPGSVTSPDRR